MCKHNSAALHMCHPSGVLMQVHVYNTWCQNEAGVYLGLEFINFKVLYVLDIHVHVVCSGYGYSANVDAGLASRDLVCCTLGLFEEGIYSRKYSMFH